MKLMIGTAQLGRNYGIANKSGQVKAHEAFNIINTALNSGISWVDTAHDYGDSEALLGTISKQLNINFNVIIKAFLGHFGAQPDLIIPSIKDSLKDLNIGCADGLLIHNPAHLIGEDSDFVYKHLCDALDIGLTRKIGVSVATPEQAEQISNRYPLDIIQVPCSLFDQRFVNSKTIDKLINKGIEVHVRSIFLQGLMFMNLSELSYYFTDIKPVLTKLHSIAKDNEISVRKLAIEYVKSINNVGRIIVGVDSSTQLQEIIDDYNSTFDIDIDFKQFTIDDDKFINPSNWDCGGWRDEV